jgi:protocatechuate 3,4-dioxygenase beta subunit
VSNPRNARLRGSLRTVSDGRFRFATIMPGHYPDRHDAAHIHVHVSRTAVPPYWIDSFLFEGDPYLRPRDIEASRAAGRFAYVMPIKHEGETIVCARDIRLDPALYERNRLVDGWYR